jgi:hypothetical protein
MSAVIEVLRRRLDRLAAAQQWAKGSMSRSTLRRRLAALAGRRGVAIAGAQVVALALGGAQGDLALIGSNWLPRSAAAGILAACDSPLKVYFGLDPRDV